MASTTTKLSFLQRAELCTNPTAKRLFLLMEKRQTNLAVAADVTDSDTLLDIANTLGPHICILKTHIDIIENFTPQLTKALSQIAEKHNFILFEDRKFADIGNTVQMQYQKGIYHIAEWASLINAHTLPGPGIIEGLKKIGLPAGHGLLLLAEMSSKGNLLDKTYTQQTITLAQKHADFVIGFIARHRCIDDPRFLHLTPGVHFITGGDTLGQQYLTPEKVIKENGSDIIILGRGIIASDDPLKTAQQYKDVAWNAYQETL